MKILERYYTGTVRTKIKIKNSYIVRNNEKNKQLVRLRVNATLDLSSTETENDVVFNDVVEEICDQHDLLQQKLEIL